jgi:hypothetical protein
MLGPANLPRMSRASSGQLLGGSAYLFLDTRGLRSSGNLSSPVDIVFLSSVYSADYGSRRFLPVQASARFWARNPR